MIPLDIYIKKNDNLLCDVNVYISFFLKIFEALCILHNNGIFHMDVKLDNILVEEK